MTYAYHNNIITAAINARKVAMYGFGIAYLLHNVDKDNQFLVFENIEDVERYINKKYNNVVIAGSDEDFGESFSVIIFETNGIGVDVAMSQFHPEYHVVFKMDQLKENRY
jgi:hypothetical protein